MSNSELESEIETIKNLTDSTIEESILQFIDRGYKTYDLYLETIIKELDSTYIKDIYVNYNHNPNDIIPDFSVYDSNNFNDTINNYKKLSNFRHIFNFDDIKFIDYYKSSFQNDKLRTQIGLLNSTTSSIVKKILESIINKTRRTFDILSLPTHHNKTLIYQGYMYDKKKNKYLKKILTDISIYRLKSHFKLFKENYDEKINILVSAIHNQSNKNKEQDIIINNLTLEIETQTLKNKEQDIIINNLTLEIENQASKINKLIENHNLYNKLSLIIIGAIIINYLYNKK